MNKKEKAKEKAKGAGYLAGAAAVGGLAVKHGAHRAVGVRLESHSTSRDTAKKIMKEGGVLDPKYGSSGVSARENNDSWQRNSKNKVHITGVHPDTKNVKHKKIASVIKPIQRSYYRGVSEKKLSGSPHAGHVLQGALHIKGKSLYIGGSDKYFKKNFKEDPTDIAMTTDKKIKVSESRGKATLATLKKYGRGSHIKGAKLLMKHHKGRVATGVAILGTGGAGAAHLAKKGYNKLKGESLLTRTKRKVKDNI
jgi:hypothetical protein